MDSATNNPDRRQLAAYTAPMLVFFGGLALVSLLRRIGGAFWLDASEGWVYPIQTLACAALLLWFRRENDFKRLRGVFFALAIGVIVFLLWIAPQAFLGFAPRTTGYNPEAFTDSAVLYWILLGFRFLRLVVVVPFVEEIFWRGFLLRYLVQERFTEVPFGTFSWFSFAGVALGFMLVHLTADWPAALVTGAFYNIVAYRTKSLGACVVTHAVTNLLLGLWIMHTRQWGFW